MALPFYLARRNRLAYPAGFRPGYDPVHIASNAVRLSVVPRGPAWVDLLTGKVSSSTGNTNSGIYHPLGPFAEQNGSAALSYTISGQPTSEASITFAAIFFSTSPATNQIMISNSTAGFNQFSFGVFSNQTTLNMINVAGNTSGLTVTANVPYFGAASCNVSSGKINFVLTDLISGKVTSSTSTNVQTINSGNGTAAICAEASASSYLRGKQAAAMYSGAFMSLQSLLQWANDPWSFWYPSAPQSVFGVSAVSTFTPFAGIIADGASFTGLIGD